jgi:hypothetical protein
MSGLATCLFLALFAFMAWGCAGAVALPLEVTPTSTSTATRTPTETPTSTPTVTFTATPEPVRYRATLTFYDCDRAGFCDTMANGQVVFDGAAACGYALAIGTTFVVTGDPTGRAYVCTDRGRLGDWHVDVWFLHAADGWAWQRAVGRVGQIEVLP